MAKARSLVFKLCDEYFQKTLEYDAISSTYAGESDQNAHWNDYSFHKIDPFLKVAKEYKKKISDANPIDIHDELAKKVILNDIDNYIASAEDYWSYIDFGSIYSEPQSMYEVFEVMPKETNKDILNIIKRMEAIPSAFTQWATSLVDVGNLGYVNSKERVAYLSDILNNYSNGMFVQIAENVSPKNKRLKKAATEAEMACEQLSCWLASRYTNVASEKWAVGEERYLKNVKEYSGLDINPKEIYQWGLDELKRINAEMWELSKQWGEFDSLIDIRDYLNSHPDYVIDGKDNFKKFLEGVIAKATKELGGTIFTIPAAMKKCEVIMDEDTIDESPYYKDPSDDLLVPGRTYYPVLGRTRFTTWENYSTWFHESIPGHHMQIGISKLNKSTLTRYQREVAWNSGYGEGWALYSEKLMDELGYFDDPGYKMGYLMCQAMRAARLVVDIGLHLEYDDLDGSTWNYWSAARFMQEYALLNENYAYNEIKRYISWPGQAITYKIGERVWLQAREKAKNRLGDKFDLKKFHMYALKLGPMGLDILQDELAKWNGK